MVCLLYATVHELKKFIELSALQALQLAYNTGGVQVFLHIVLCFTGNQVQHPQYLAFHRLLRSLSSSLQSFSALTNLNSHTALQSLASHTYCDK